MLFIDQPEQVDLFPHVHWKDEETEQPQGQSMLDQREKTQLSRICYDLDDGSIRFQGALLSLLDEMYMSEFHHCDTSGNRDKMDEGRGGMYTPGRGLRECFFIKHPVLRHAFWHSSAQRKYISKQN